LHTALRSLDLADPYATNPAAPDGSGSSHAWGVAAVNASADSVGPLPGGEMERYLKGGLIKCATCHDQHNSDVGYPLLRVSNAGDAMCKECHAARAEGLGELGTHPVGFAYPGATGEFPDASSSGLPPLKDAKVECATCHAPHFADSGGANAGAGDGMLLRGANDGTFCQTCHTEHPNHEVRGGWQPTCTDCHDVHDPSSANLALVARMINTTGIVFQDNDLGSNAVSDFIHSNHASVSYDGVCEVCHTGTSYHRNSPAGNHDHYADSLCTDCHPHSEGFKPGAGACTSCHGQPPDGDVSPNLAGAHATHMMSTNGPQIGDCFECHAPLAAGVHNNTVASFASGVDANSNGDIELSETDVCDACHSPDGPFDGVAEGKANWTVGAAVSCEGCHDTGTSTIQGVTAPPVAGNNTTWGYFATGHGRNGALGCAACHDTTTTHFDGVARTYAFDSAYYGPAQSGVAYAAGYRLREVGGEVPLMIPANYSITFNYIAQAMA
ncbi:MAG: hypothetical protein GY842_01290, partial [bacterium]|nr:hypothetical protein [bacterium]